MSDVGQHRVRVLSVGIIPELLSLRARVLNWSGYQVVTITNPLEAASHILDGHCGVLLLCYSIPDDWRKGLIYQYRQHCPDGRIVVISNQPVEVEPKNVDALVYGIDGPEILLDAVAGRKAA